MQQACWSRAWLTVRWLQLLSGVTSERSTLDRGVASWISSLRDTRARESRSQGVAAGSPTSDGCGTTSGESFARWNPDSSSWRTWPPTSDEASESSLVTLPRAGGVSSGIAYRRQPSAPRTSAIASSCWLPTPMSSDASRGLRDGTSKRQGTPNLGEALAALLLPTPTARDWKGRTNDQRNSPSLPDALIPTPAASDAKGFGSEDSASSRGETGLCLNPAFVEWMMGLPPGWTDCTSSETVSCPRPQPERSERCGEG